MTIFKLVDRETGEESVEYAKDMVFQRPCDGCQHLKVRDAAKCYPLSPYQKNAIRFESLRESRVAEQEHPRRTIHRVTTLIALDEYFLSRGPPESRRVTFSGVGKRVKVENDLLLQ